MQSRSFRDLHVAQLRPSPLVAVHAVLCDEATRVEDEVGDEGEKERGAAR
jgi:hypothetical protein